MLTSSHRPSPFFAHFLVLATALFASGMGSCSSASAGRGEASGNGGSSSVGASTGSRRGAGLTGRVIGPNGEPVVSAEVWLIDSSSIDAAKGVVASRTLGDWVETSRAVAEEVGTSDAEGRVQFNHEIKNGFLMAARKRHAFGLVERTLAPSRGELIEIQLKDRKAYSVALTDADGKPAAGVAITLAAPDPSEPELPYMLPAASITDADGLATLVEPPSTAKGIIDGLDEVPERLAILRLAVTELEPIALPDDGSVTRAILPPMTTLTVACRHPGFSRDHWSGIVQVFPAADGSRSTRTLAARIEGGVLRVPYVSATEDLRVVAVVSESAEPARLIGTLTLEADAPEIEAETSSDAEIVAASMKLLPDGREIDLPLDAGVLLTGRCVDESGAAMANTTMDLFVVGDASASWKSVTDGEGRFRWLLIRPGKALAKVVVGARPSRGVTRATTRLGEVEPGQVVDLGVLRLR